MGLRTSAAYWMLMTCAALTATSCRHGGGVGTDSIGRMRALLISMGGERRLADFDLTADGLIGPEDWSTFDELAVAARTELTRRGRSTSVLKGLYHGSDDAAAQIFRSVRESADDFGVAGMSTETLWQVAIESRWLGLQARAASLAPQTPRGNTFGGLLASEVPGYNPDRMSPTELCRAVDAIDTAPLRSVGLQATAVTDLDSTVWRGNVMDVFLAVLVEQQLPHPDANAELIGYLKGLADVDAAQVESNTVVDNARLLLERWRNESLPAASRPTAKDTFYQIAQLMRGMTPQEARAAARVAFEKGALDYPAWSTQVFDDADGCGMRQLIAHMEAHGVEMYLLSATPDVLAWEAARVLGIPEGRAIGSLLEVVDGRYTGRVFDSTYYTKGTIVRQWLPAPPLLAFGDSVTSDFSMLAEAVGVGFMINPHEAFLARDAKEAGSRLVAVSYGSVEGGTSALP
ncbi:MAG: haloacid dehalogenase-like hydrolase [Myxococcota bacterium]